MCSLFDRQCMRPGDGVSVQEREKAPERLEEGPVGQQADALVAVYTSASIRLDIRALQAQLGSLSIG